MASLGSLSQRFENDELLIDDYLTEGGKMLNFQEKPAKKKSQVGSGPLQLTGFDWSSHDNPDQCEQPDVARHKNVNANGSIKQLLLDLQQAESSFDVQEMKC